MLLVLCPPPPPCDPYLHLAIGQIGRLPLLLLIILHTYYAYLHIIFIMYGTYEAYVVLAIINCVNNRWMTYIRNRHLKLLFSTLVLKNFHRVFYHMKTLILGIMLQQIFNGFLVPELQKIKLRQIVCNPQILELFSKAIACSSVASVSNSNITRK